MTRQTLIRTPKTDEKALMVLAAMRLITGTAGGLPQRKIDHSNSGTYSTLVGAFLTGWREERAALEPKPIEMRIWGSDLRAGDQIAISTTRGMETYEAPVASTDAGSSTCVTYHRTDGSRGNVAADERIWVRRVGG